ncbi:MAG: hypothetical protein ABIH89_04705, partial [Elusimicrobiota bacterium]
QKSGQRISEEKKTIPAGLKFKISDGQAELVITKENFDSRVADRIELQKAQNIQMKSHMNWGQALVFALTHMFGGGDDEKAAQQAVLDEIVAAVLQQLDDLAKNDLVKNIKFEIDDELEKQLNTHVMMKQHVDHCNSRMMQENISILDRIAMLNELLNQINELEDDPEEKAALLQESEIYSEFRELLSSGLGLNAGVMGQWIQDMKAKGMSASEINAQIAQAGGMDRFKKPLSADLEPILAEVNTEIEKYDTFEEKVDAALIVLNSYDTLNGMAEEKLAILAGSDLFKGTLDAQQIDLAWNTVIDVVIQSDSQISVSGELNNITFQDLGLDNQTQNRITNSFRNVGVIESDEELVSAAQVVEALKTGTVSIGRKSYEALNAALTDKAVEIIVSETGLSGDTVRAALDTGADNWNDFMNTPVAKLITGEISSAELLIEASAEGTVDEKMTVVAGIMVKDDTVSALEGQELEVKVTELLTFAAGSEMSDAEIETAAARIAVILGVDNSALTPNNKIKQILVETGRTEYASVSEAADMPVENLVSSLPEAAKNKIMAALSKANITTVKQLISALRSGDTDIDLEPAYISAIYDSLTKVVQPITASNSALLNADVTTEDISEALESAPQNWDDFMGTRLARYVAGEMSDEDFYMEIVSDADPEVRQAVFAEVLPDMSVTESEIAGMLTEYSIVPEETNGQVSADIVQVLRSGDDNAAKTQSIKTIIIEASAGAATQLAEAGKYAPDNTVPEARATAGVDNYTDVSDMTDMPVAALYIPEAVRNRILQALDNAGVKTVGQLADKLAKGENVGLGAASLNVVYKALTDDAANILSKPESVLTKSGVGNTQVSTALTSSSELTSKQISEAPIVQHLAGSISETAFISTVVSEESILSKSMILSEMLPVSSEAGDELSTVEIAALLVDAGVTTESAAVQVASEIKYVLDGEGDIETKKSEIRMIMGLAQFNSIDAIGNMAVANFVQTLNISAEARTEMITILESAGINTVSQLATAMENGGIAGLDNIAIYDGLAALTSDAMALPGCVLPKNGSNESDISMMVNRNTDLAGTETLTEYLAGDISLGELTASYLAGNISLAELYMTVTAEEPAALKQLVLAEILPVSMGSETGEPVSLEKINSLLEISGVSTDIATQDAAKAIEAILSADNLTQEEKTAQIRIQLGLPQFNTVSEFAGMEVEEFLAASAVPQATIETIKAVAAENNIETIGDLIGKLVSGEITSLGAYEKAQLYNALAEQSADMLMLPVSGFASAEYSRADIVQVLKNEGDQNSFEETPLVRCITGDISGEVLSMTVEAEAELGKMNVSSVVRGKTGEKTGYNPETGELKVEGSTYDSIASVFGLTPELAIKVLAAMASFEIHRYEENSAEGYIEELDKLGGNFAMSKTEKVALPMWLSWMKAVAGGSTQELSDYIAEKLPGVTSKQLIEVTEMASKINEGFLGEVQNIQPSGSPGYIAAGIKKYLEEKGGVRDLVGIIQNIFAKTADLTAKMPFGVLPGEGLINGGQINTIAAYAFGNGGSIIDNLKASMSAFLGGGSSQDIVPSNLIESVLSST